MLPISLQNLATSFRLFSGVGQRSSQKMAMDVIQMKNEDFDSLVESIIEARRKVKFCSKCGFFADFENDEIQDSQKTPLLCQICKDKRRDNTQICLVEKPTDVMVMEKSESYNGVYFVLQKLISPLDKIFPADTEIEKFINQYLPTITPSLKTHFNNSFEDEKEIELILFFKAGFSADATTMFLKEALAQNSSLKLKISRLAQGLPLYYNPETLDKATMIKALEDRRSL